MWAVTPYEVGARYFLEQTKAGIPPKAVHDQRPANMEQVFHPEKRGAPPPTPVQFPALPQAEWLYRDCWGESEVRTVISATQTWQETLRAAIGWDGDEVRVYRAEDTGPFAVWISHWDREQDAKEFYGVMRGILEGSFVRKGRRVAWYAASKRTTLRTIGSALRTLPEPPAAPKGEPESTANAQERAVALTRATATRGGTQWRIGDTGLLLKDVTLSRDPYRNGPIPVFVDGAGTTLAVHADVWPGQLFPGLDGLERHLREGPGAARLTRVKRFERFLVGPYRAAIVEREILATSEGVVAHTEELFVQTRALLVHLVVRFPAATPESRRRRARDVLRAVAYAPQ